MRDDGVELSDLWCQRQHTYIVKELRDSNNLFPVIKHSCSNIDFTYHFNMFRFNILGHFIVSGNLFEFFLNLFGG